MYNVRYKVEHFETEVCKKKVSKIQKQTTDKILLSFIKPDGGYKKQYNSSKVFIDAILL